MALDRKQRRSAVEEAAERAHATSALGTVIGHLSKGFRQRVALAAALIGKPAVLLLDEPTAGLDPNQVEQVRELIREIARDRAVLLSTHVLSEVEATCQRVLVLARGSWYSKASFRLCKSHRRANTSVRVRSTRAEVEAAVALAVQPGRVELEDGEGDALRLIGHGSDPGAMNRLLRALIEQGITIDEAAPRRAALHEVFQAATRGEP